MTDGSVSTAGGVQDEGVSAHSRVEVALGVAKERENPCGRVVATDSVGKERVRAGGNIVVSFGVERQGIQTDGCVFGTKGVTFGCGVTDSRIEVAGAVMEERLSANRRVPCEIGGSGISSNHVIKLPKSLSRLSWLKISMGNNYLKLKDQVELRRQFPGATFDFVNEYDDVAANEESRK